MAHPYIHDNKQSYGFSACRIFAPLANTFAQVASFSLV